MARKAKKPPRENPSSSDPHLLFHSVMESVADGVLAVDKDFNINVLNPAACEIIGVSREDAIGRKCFDVLRADMCSGSCPAREAMKSGKPVSGRRITMLNAEGEEFIASVTAAPLRDAGGEIVGSVETFRDLSTLELLRKELAQSYTYKDIVGKSACMRQLFRILPPIAESESTVLVEGESGTGKELFARAVHDLSPRHKEPYVVINCGALPDTLLESELFGYKKGAFTDARKDKPGKFAIAKGGSIFLDEVETLTQSVQVKLLRVIQEREFEPLGGSETVKADVRIIAASNRPLRDMVSQGRFRDDLFYRLNVVTLELPPLRERRADIPLLVDHFVSFFNDAKGKTIVGMAPNAMRALMAHDYPGNVRELQNAIEHAFVLCGGGLIEAQHLPRNVFANGNDAPPQVETPIPGDTAAPTNTLSKQVEDVEADTIRTVLTRNKGHRGKTAQELGISHTTLWRRMKRYGIQDYDAGASEEFD